MVLQHLCIYGRVVGLLSNKSKDSLNFRDVTILFWAGKKKGDVEMAWTHSPSIFFKTLRRRLLLGAGSCIFFSKPKKKTAPGCWVTWSETTYTFKVKYKSLPDGIYLHWLIMLSIARLLVEKPPKNRNVRSAQFLHWEGCWFGCIEKWAT
jgi:hypothetical protein